MTDLKALLKRVEGVSGPDALLDEALWLHFVPGATFNLLHIDHPKGAYDIRETRDSTRRLIIVPSYTASIDAALGLVEKVLPGWTYMLDARRIPTHEGVRCKLLPPDIAAHGDENLIGRTATMPLAILAALLKSQLPNE